MRSRQLEVEVPCCAEAARVVDLRVRVADAVDLIDAALRRYPANSDLLLEIRFALTGDPQ